MYLFTLLLFPCAFAYYVSRRFSALRPRLLISLAAFVAAGLVSAFRGFFMFRTPYDGANLARFFAETWFSCAVFPLLVFALLMLVSRDERADKIGSFALFALPFYAVYLPAEIFANPVPLPFFWLFVKPVLYLVMSVAVAGEFRALSELLLVRGSARLVSALAVLAEITVPALIETLWYYVFPVALWCALLLAYLALCAFRSHLVAKVKEKIIHHVNTDYTD